MEYANRHTWKVIAYDRNDKPMLMQENLPKWVAERVGDRWLARSDVLRVEGYDAEIKITERVH